MLLSEKEFEVVIAESDRIAERLLELGVDSVRVFVSAGAKGDETLQASTGRGNFHAQQGQVREWLIRQDESPDDL